MTSNAIRSMIRSINASISNPCFFNFASNSISEISNNFLIENNLFLSTSKTLSSRSPGIFLLIIRTIQIQSKMKRRKIPLWWIYKCLWSGPLLLERKAGKETKLIKVKAKEGLLKMWPLPSRL